MSKPRTENEEKLILELMRCENFISAPAQQLIYVVKAERGMQFNGTHNIEDVLPSAGPQPMKGRHVPSEEIPRGTITSAGEWGTIEEY